MKAGGNPAPLNPSPHREKWSTVRTEDHYKVSVTLPRLEFRQCTEWHSF